MNEFYIEIIEETISKKWIHKIIINDPSLLNSAAEQIHSFLELNDKYYGQIKILSKNNSNKHMFYLLLDSVSKFNIESRYVILHKSVNEFFDFIRYDINKKNIGYVLTCL